MFQYQMVNHPESFLLDESRIARVFELVSVVPPVSVTARTPLHEVSLGYEAIQVLGPHKNMLQKGILNIAFLSDDEIRILNRDHRGIDKTTDVLSFHYFEDFSDVAVDDIVGEIILSESRILAQAEEYGHTAEKEFETLVIHSILHIIGFDHETDEDYETMWSYEEPLRKAILN